MSDSPPPSWYEPPEPRHRDCSIIPDECNCSECHDGHIERDEVVENSDNSDYQCCVDQMDIWIEDKQRCAKHPSAYAEPIVDGNKKVIGIYCEQCDLESASPTTKPDGTPSPSGLQS